MLPIRNCCDQGRRTELVRPSLPRVGPWVGTCLDVHYEVTKMTCTKKPGKALDMEAALVHAGGDRPLLEELAAMFVQDCPHLLDDARTSIRKADCESLERVAHTLRGRLAFFGLQTTSERALELEMTGRNRDWSHALEVLTRVESEMEPILAELHSLTLGQNL